MLFLFYFCSYNFYINYSQSLASITLMFVTFSGDLILYNISFKLLCTAWQKVCNT